MNTIACERCHGDGEIPVNPGYPDPQTETSAQCPDCHGTGRTLEPCCVCGEELTRGGVACDRCHRNLEEDRLERESNR